MGAERAVGEPQDTGKASEIVVAGVGYADEEVLLGTGGLDLSWKERGVRPLGTARLYRELFGRADDTFRRLDRQTKLVVLAAAAIGIEGLLDPRSREQCALVTETTYGSLETDRRYASVMTQGFVHAAIFPYVLPSTCTGDIALRHGLRGPTICLSVEAGAEGESVREACRMLATGEVRHALAVSVDALGPGEAALAPRLRGVTVLLTTTEHVPDGIGPDGVVPWCGAEGNPFDVFIRSLHGQEAP